MIRYRTKFLLSVFFLKKEVSTVNGHTYAKMLDKDLFTFSVTCNLYKIDNWDTNIDAPYYEWLFQRFVYSN